MQKKIQVGLCTISVNSGDEVEPGSGSQCGGRVYFGGHIVIAGGVQQVNFISFELFLLSHNGENEQTNYFISFYCENILN